MRDTEELRDIARAPESHLVASQKYIADPGQSVAMLDQPGGRCGILPAPVSGDDPCFEEAVYTTETQLSRRGVGVRECLGLNFDPPEETLAHIDHVRGYL